MKLVLKLHINIVVKFIISEPSENNINLLQGFNPLSYFNSDDVNEGVVQNFDLILKVKKFRLLEI